MNTLCCGRFPFCKCNVDACLCICECVDCSNCSNCNKCLKKDDSISEKDSSIKVIGMTMKINLCKTCGLSIFFKSIKYSDYTDEDIKMSNDEFIEWRKKFQK